MYRSASDRNNGLFAGIAGSDYGTRLATGHTAPALSRPGLSSGKNTDSLTGTFFSMLRIIIAVPLLLTIDSPYGDALLSGHGQAVANLLTFMAFLYAYQRRTRRVQKIMLIGMFVGMGLELICSVGLGLYHYRFGNVPLWIAFGHGLIYAVSYRMMRQQCVRDCKQSVQYALLAFAILYSLVWLFVANDWFGLLCTMVFLLILRASPKSRFFFLIMYAVVAYIEQVGTFTGCWHWPATLAGVHGWMASGNPPSGVVVGYFLFDAGVSYIYLHLLYPETRRRYQARSTATA